MKRVREYIYDRDGVLYFRRAVPQDVREAFSGKTEIVVSLDTGSIAEARLWMIPHLRGFERTLAQARGRRDPTSEPVLTTSEPSRDQIAAAVRAWVKERSGHRHREKGAGPARLRELAHQSTVTASAFEFGGDAPNLQTRWIAEGLRSAHGWAMAEETASFDYLVRLVARGQMEAANQESDEITNRPPTVRDVAFSPEEYRLDAMREVEAQANGTVSLNNLFDRYCAEAKPAPASIKAARIYLTKFIEFLGHDDAARVQAADVLAWKDKLVAEPLKDGAPRSPKTINDGYLSTLKTVFRWAVENRKLVANPAADVRARAPKRIVLREKGLTEAEALLILKATLLPPSSRTSPEFALARRWVPWICAYTGARVNEITQARAEDVRQVEGVWCIRITPEAGSVKTGKARVVPLHPHLIDQGFVRLVEGKSGPLFYQPLRHRGGSSGNPQAKKAGERLAKWVRELGVDDPAVAPNHGWRHRFKTVARGRIDAETRDAIQGHRARTEGEDYGDFPIAVLKAAIDKLPRYRVPGAGLPPARKRSRPSRT